MPVTARSARGVVVDFDILQIKQQLASNPVQVGTEERRRFIDTKDGVKPKIVNTVPEVPNGLKDIGAMSFAAQSFVVEEPVAEEPVIEEVAIESTEKTKKAK